jgi:hypothetical protein
MRRRLGSLLGLTLAETDLLTARCRARLGARSYRLRLIALLLATAPLLRNLVPETVRRRAIRPFVYELLSGVSENLLYAGIQPSRSPLAADD